MMLATTSDLWDAGIKIWQLLGSPLRPSPADVAIYRKEVARLTRPGKSLGVLVLGSTPEFADLGWPSGTDLLAMDQNPKMLSEIWLHAAHQATSPRAIRGNWLRCPIPNADRDMVLADGSFTPLDFPGTYRRLFARIHRVLRADGRAIIRFFLRPELGEDPQAVVQGFLRATEESFHALKLRLIMSLQTSVERGVALGDVWRTWQSSLAGAAITQADHPLYEQVETIRWYQDRTDTYTFPSLDELRRSFAPWFVEERIEFPSYELGERCPIITLRPRANVRFDQDW